MFQVTTHEDQTASPRRPGLGSPSPKTPFLISTRKSGEPGKFVLLLHPPSRFGSFQYHLELELSCVPPSIFLAHVIVSFAPSGDNIIPALFNSLPTIRGSNLGARLQGGITLFDLLVLPLVAVSRQVAVTLHPICQEELYNPGRDVSINPNKDSILTSQRPVPDVRLGYASTGQKQDNAGERAVVSHEQPFG